MAPMRRPRWPLLGVSLIISTCLVAIGVAVSIAVTGREAAALPAAIEATNPSRGARQVPAQTQIQVDLVDGYTGVLVIDGIELETVNIETVQTAQPGQQVTLPPTTIYEPGNATLTFAPSEAAAITGFSQGEHVARVIYWKIIDGRGTARSFTWTFEVF